MKNTLKTTGLAVIGLMLLGSAGGAAATNRGKHIIGGFGRHHRGGLMVGHQTNRGMHIVGGHGQHHRGGHMVR